MPAAASSVRPDASSTTNVHRRTALLFFSVLIPGPVFLMGCDQQVSSLAEHKWKGEKRATPGAVRRRVSFSPVFLGPYARHEAQRNRANGESQAGARQRG